MTDNRGRRHTEKAGSSTTHSTTHRRPPGSFKGAPDEDKGGREGERAHGTAAPEHTTGAGEEDKRREGKEGRREAHGWPRAWGAEEGITAAGREQTENRQTEKKSI